MSINEGCSRALATSKYDEDAVPCGHGSVWGSFFCPQKGWGYACCRSCDRHAPPCRETSDTERPEPPQPESSSEAREVAERCWLPRSSFETSVGFLVDSNGKLSCFGSKIVCCLSPPSVSANCAFRSNGCLCALFSSRLCCSRRMRCAILVPPPPYTRPWTSLGRSLLYWKGTRRLRRRQMGSFATCATPLHAKLPDAARHAHALQYFLQRWSLARESEDLKVSDVKDVMLNEPDLSIGRRKKTENQLEESMNFPAKLREFSR
eukprot:s1667_g3.t1